MFANSYDNEKLFAKSVPICLNLKDVETGQSLRTTRLFLTLEWQKASTGVFSSKVLAITLTDENDPFFLYTSNLSEEDFHTFKVDEGIKVDFSSFPQYMIDYIEKCLLDDGNPQPKFILIFTVTDKFGNASSCPDLLVLELNNFRNLAHLTVKFVPASESAVRQYLVSSFRKLRDQNTRLQNSLTSKERECANLKTSSDQKLNSKEEEFELFRQQSEANLSQTESKYSRELQEERNRHQTNLREAEEQYETDLKEKEQKFQKQIKQLETKLSNLEHSNKDLQTESKRDESTIRELQAKIKSLDNEIRKLNESSRMYKHKCEESNDKLNNKDSYIFILQKNIQELKNDMQSKEQIIARQDRQIESYSKDIQNLQADLERAKLDHEISEEHVKSLKKETKSLNDVINSLQKKYKDANEKLKQKQDLCARLEKEIEVKEKSLDTLQTEVREQKIILEAKNKEVETFKELANKYQTKIGELKEKEKIKENVIKFLNNQLAENCTFPQYPIAVSPKDVAEEKLDKVKSRSSLDNSPVTVASRLLSKYSTPSGEKSTYTPSHQMTGGTDSAYCTDASGRRIQHTPDNNCRNNYADREMPDPDPDAVSATFGDHTPKTSTAKKKTDPARRQPQTQAPLKSSVSRISKKR